MEQTAASRKGETSHAGRRETADCPENLHLGVKRAKRERLLYTYGGGGDAPKADDGSIGAKRHHIVETGCRSVNIL